MLFDANSFFKDFENKIDAVINLFRLIIQIKLLIKKKHVKLNVNNAQRVEKKQKKTKKVKIKSFLYKKFIFNFHILIKLRQLITSMFRNPLHRYLHLP